MLALFSLILVLIGCANWLTIGLLQFDFVAGLFGSQSNIFSRIVYVIVGVAAIILTINIIKNKGKIGFNFKKINFKKQPELAKANRLESSSDMSKEDKESNYAPQSNNAEYAKDYKSISEKLSARHQENNNVKK